MISSAEVLFAPHGLGTFLKAVTERKRIHLRTENQATFSCLLSWSSFNRLLMSERLFDPRTRIVRRGRDLPQEMWSFVDQNLTRQVAHGPLQRLCQEGASIALAQVHQSVPAIAALGAMLERTFPAVKIQTNLYASFGQESAFRSHYDSHDVLILHLHGRKRWFSYGPCQDYGVGSPQIADADLGPVQWEDTLEPGDILYLPRGEVHRAAVEGDACLHLTLSLTWPRGRDSLFWLADRTSEAGFLDSDIPVYGDSDALQRYAEELRHALHRLVDTLSLPQLVSDFAQSRKPLLSLNLGLGALLTPDVWVQTVLRSRDALPPEPEERITVNGVSIQLNADDRAVLRILLEIGAMQLAGLEDRTSLSSHDVRQAVGRLAAQSLVWLTEP